MDCDSIANQFNKMSILSNGTDIPQQTVHLEKPEKQIIRKKDDNDFSDERLNEVKQRLKARQAERDSKTPINTPKLISLDEAIRLYNEEKKETEVRFSRYDLNTKFRSPFVFIP
jgi:hypothetical protein